MRTIQIIAAATVAAAALVGLWVGVFAPMLADRAVNRIGYGDYTLSSTDGTTFTEASLQGKATVVFFGFTHCPDVCPTTLGDMMGWQAALGERADDLRIVFITVDPERDSVDLLKEYVGWLPGAIGLTGPVDEVKAAEGAFRVFSQKEPLEGGDYTMSHTSKVILFDSAGEFSDTISYQEPQDSALTKLETLLAG